MRAGALRNIITIERRVQAGVNSLNEPNYTWVTWREPYAAILVMRGKEHFDATTQQRYSETVWRFTVRYDEVIGIDTTMRILHDGMYFDLRAPRPDADRRQDCVLECTLQDGQVEAAPLAIAITEQIVDGVEGEVYAGFTVSAVGGTAPYVFTVASGALPTGLTLDLTAMTWAWAGGGSVSSGSFDLVETHADAANSGTHILPPPPGQREKRPWN